MTQPEESAEARTDGNYGSFFPFAARFGQPVVKDGCGVFGVIRKADARRISSSVAVNGISCVKYRGSNLGAGYAAFSGSNAGNAKKNPPYLIQAFVTDQNVADRITNRFKEIGRVEDCRFRSTLQPTKSKVRVWETRLSPDNVSDRIVESTVNDVNLSLIDGSFEGRVFSYGRYVRIYKEVGYPLDVARMWGLDSKDMEEEADVWLAHTRQPTNSPGSLPVWSHPFASLNTAIVHNGDISSFGSNMELLNSWNILSHIGTDSEVIATLLDRLVRVEGLSVTEAATVLTNPFERDTSKGVLRLLYKYRGARLDGPFAVIAGYADGDDTYLIALTDRSKFRPLLIGEDDHNFYVASEENQIRNLSKNARVWTPEPGSFFIASLSKGMIESGTDRSVSMQSNVLLSSPAVGEDSGFLRIDASRLEFQEINKAISAAMSRGEEGISIDNCAGHRYIGIGASPNKDNDKSAKGHEKRAFTIRLNGYPGNCLANLNDGASFEVFGNVADDLADTMHAGSVIVHGNARDVVGQALQGGSIFVRGTVGNRAAIQMREYTQKRPFLVVGETADDYLGEYMAGGVVVILNLSNSIKPARNYIGTGMVGGKIYIRGNVSDAQIGLTPEREDVLSYVRSCTLDGSVPKEAYDEVSSAEYPTAELLFKHLPENIFSRVMFLFFSTKYTRQVIVERRRLDEQDLLLLSDTLQTFFRTFSIPHELSEEILRSEFTIMRAKDDKIEMKVPPQEAPVEE